MKYVPHNYQRHARQHIIDNKGAGLFIDMGLGKTSIALSSIDTLMYQEFEIMKALVIAPKRVAAHVWNAEIEKWDDFKHLTYVKIMGTEKERITALKKDADIYLINYDLLSWLVTYLGSRWFFDMVIADESSKLKSAKSGRFKALRSIRPKIKRFVCLTGTPASNGLLDLWSQVYLMDRGERLGKTITDYRGRYFKKDAYKPFAKWEIHRENDELIGEGYYEKKIYNKISDICISMKAEDYLELPETVINDIPIYLDSATKSKYEEFEKEKVLEIMNGEEITAVNAGALCTKLLQFANGAVYDNDTNNKARPFYELHDEKLNELEDIVEQAAGKPILVFYNFQHDAIRIRNRLAAYKPRDLKTDQDIKDWNAGKIEIALVHPKSTAYGLNLQEGGHIIVFFGLLWSLELYLQAMGRLVRQGQLHTVIIHRLITQGTVDEEVVARLFTRDKEQGAMLRYVKVLIKKHTGRAAA